MNILVFCSNPVNGGTARIFYELVTAMRQMIAPENKVIACINENNPVDIYKKIKDVERIPIRSEEEVFPGMYGGTFPRRILNHLHRSVGYSKIKRRNINIMRRYLREKQVDTVLIHNGGYVGDDLCNQMLTAAYRCAEYTPCRTYVMHSDMKKNLCSKIRFWAYDKKISREATEIVTVSQFTKDRIFSSSFINRDIKVIYNGISDYHILMEEEKRRTVYVDSQNVNILMIGNFTDNKGQHKFLEVAKILKKENRSYHFTIIGNIYDEAYFKKCKSLIEKFDLTEEVSIYHNINNAFEFIDLFEILVVPSMYDESFGLISVEAMANKRPVVAFACGGIPEVVIDGQDGFVVPIGDAKLMAEKIKWLVEHPDERRIMEEQCRKDYVEKFSVEAMAKGYIELIKSEDTFK